MTRTIAFAHHKGGTGKTTSCLNIAGYLAKAGKKVLIVDMDPQGNATSGLGIDKETLDASMYEVMVAERKIRDIILETDSGIHLAPSTLNLMGAESYLYRRRNRATALKKRLRNIKKYYDYIMIDTPPGSGLFLINGVIAADHTIVTLDPSVFALEGIETLKTIFDDINEHVGVKIKPAMALLTRCNKASRFSRLLGKTDPVKEVEKDMREIFGRMFAIPFSVEVYESQLKGVPISHYSPNCGAGKAYKGVAKVIDEEAEKSEEEAEAEPRKS